MNTLKKPFWESKIIIASIINFIFSMVTIYSGWTIPEDVLAKLPDQVLKAIQSRETWATASAVLSVIMIISRSIFKGGEQIKEYWKSGVFWGAILMFTANLVSFFTGVPIPDSLTAQLVEAITSYATTGDIFTLLSEVIGIAIVIFRLFKTEKTVVPPLEITHLIGFRNAA